MNNSFVAKVVSSKTFAVGVTAFAMYAANRFTLRKVNAFHRDHNLNKEFVNYLVTGI